MAKDKHLENTRWRAEKFGKYYHIQFENKKIICMRDGRDVFDDYRYNSGNYFRTEKAAQKIVDKIEKILKNSKPE